MTIPAPLVTERLELRKPGSGDAEPLFETCFGEAGVMRYMTWKRHRDLSETRSLLQALARRWEEGLQAHWVIATRHDRMPVGMVSLRLESRANLSYLLAAPLWGKGFMTEAAASVCTWALEQPAIGQLWAFCEPGNGASIRVLQKTGFQEDAPRVKYAVFPNLGEDPRDCRLFTRDRE